MVEALNNLAWLLAAHPSDALRNGAEAVRLAERACELSEHREPVMLGTLAAAYAEAGRFGDAVKTAEKARDLAAATGLRMSRRRTPNCSSVSGPASLAGPRARGSP